MKKRMSVLLSLLCALALSVSMFPAALAAEADIPVPESRMSLVSDAASTGTTTYTDSNGKTLTVYLYPAGTTFESSLLYSVSSLTDQGSSTVQYGGSFVLPESGIYQVTTMDAMASIQDIYVSADSAAAPIEQPSDWAADLVKMAVDAGLVPQQLQSKYTTPATRAEFCALAVRVYEKLKGAEITERASFTDTDDVNVQKMAGLGVVGGVGDGKFNPDGALTREQAATILSRLASAVGKPLESADPTFADNSSISSWAKDAVGQMQLYNVMNGVGNNNFAPQDPYTREQCIMTAMRLYDKLM